ncbi:curli production assembly/transport component CsgF [Thioclava sp. ES.031]|uniref:curli assembly protein CsgF n=1 Tax=Thioclava sp. ES.031 TaxID=1798203 RepID=UPI000BF5527A|nr:curli assembly protein CsgF [Thioclava sp. ES.031]PFG64018.1 curli production assembly/transport component CsgF [Thioclava sp. ES.031]
MVGDRTTFGFVALFLLVGAPLTFQASCASAQDLTYSFTSPSFGGSSFNSSHLLALADIQNQYKDDGSSKSSSYSSQSDLFVRQLQSRLLSSLSSGLSEVITGAQPGDSDTITIGDQQIFYERTLENIRVEITNLLDGSTTEIVLPVVEQAAAN